MNSLNTKRQQHMTLEIKVLAWEMHKKEGVGGGGINWLMGDHPHPLLITGYKNRR
jgi:hypothetical protein